MKIKSDFITNSSSASFIISKRHLTKEQILSIHSHIEIGAMFAKKHNTQLYLDPWRITETKTLIKGDTAMDNFDMLWFLDMIGIDPIILDYQHSNDVYFDTDKED